jgi:PPK2 family polyphosphate:nucleotide phosphotransferase
MSLWRSVHLFASLMPSVDPRVAASARPTLGHNTRAMPYVDRIEPGTRVSLGDIDPSAHAGVERKEGDRRSAELIQEMDALQEELYAAGQNALLIVLQGPDTSGKDGTIRHVLRGVSPAGCRVSSFKVPTADEASHDFLWRVHRETPPKGMIGVFNRSHYEDVVVTRVHGLVPRTALEARFPAINAFERLLSDHGTIILKFFLHISQEEQAKRLRDREADPTKAWKLSTSDWLERERWDEYQAAYEDALLRCNTPEAPWYVVPADHKWFRNLAISEAIVQTLQRFREPWREAIGRLRAERLAELARLREEGRIPT